MKFSCLRKSSQISGGQQQRCAMARALVKDVGLVLMDERSPARTQWSPTGTNVPDYPRLAQLWWQNIGDASSGAKTSQEALNALCEQQERVLSRLERSGVQGELGPVLNEEQEESYWLEQAGSPKAKLANEKPKAVTIEYDELLKTWQ